LIRVLTVVQTKPIPYTFVRDGFYYFSRRVPSDVRHHYRYPRIVRGLNTRSAQQARTMAASAAAKLDAFWSQLRLSQADVFGMHLLTDPGSQPQPVHRQSGQIAPLDKIDCPSLSDALTLYVTMKGKGRSEAFRIAADRACGYLAKVSGNKALSAYTRKDALAFRDWLVARGLSGSSVTRNFSYLKAVFNFAVAEHALDIGNPFKGVYHDRQAGVLKRMPIPMDDIRRVQQECFKLDDDMRWLVALVSDTGMRLAEAAGLLKSDFIDLDGPHPHVRLIRHPWRNLKTESSERLVPLAGASLWAAKRIMSAGGKTDFAFPRYNRTKITAANSASAALNKWLGPYVPDKCTMHSFRHSMRDRLRAVQCPSDIVDQIGGWATGGVGQGYGNGYPLAVLWDWMTRTIDHRGT
jgi:integrase